jgi:hypothetical protein
MSGKFGGDAAHRPRIWLPVELELLFPIGDWNIYFAGALTNNGVAGVAPVLRPPPSALALA